mgnify:FL=1
MLSGNPITGLFGWILHRLVANYWFLALCAVVAAPLAFGAILHFDRNGLTDWMLDNGLSPVTTADAAKETAGIVAGIDAALLTLFFSISLLVLTLAAGNLGVRLIDRWLSKRLVQVSIAGLTFTTLFSVLTLAAIDSEAELAQTPLATITVMLVLLAVNLAMLAVALHDLGRTMFIDKAIDALAKDARTPSIDVIGVERFTGEFAQLLPAPRSGYVEGVDLDELEKSLKDHPGIVRICVAPGQHVLAGEPVAALEHRLDNPKSVVKSIPIGPFRSNSQGTVFQIRLLVEIAARALSPAINDFYTALAAADSLAEVIAGHSGNWVDADKIPARAHCPQFELPGQDFRGLFADPLAAFRQAAADYPSVAIRMTDNYRRICEPLFAQDPDKRQEALIDFLYDEAKSLTEHAAARAQYSGDRRDIEAAFEGFKHMRMAGRDEDRPAARTTNPATMDPLA